MIERPIPTTPRLRAGSPPASNSEPRHWLHERAPSLRNVARDRQRRERTWAWLSLVALIVCWDASSRIGERVSIPRPKLAHALEDEMFRPSAALSADL